MKFTISMLLCFLSITISGYSQSTFFEVTETPPFEDVKRAGVVLDVFNFDNGDIVVLREAKRALLVSDFNNKQALTNNVEIEIEKKESFIGSTITGDILRIFTKFRVDRKTREFYCHSYVLGSDRATKTQLYSITKGKGKGKFGFLSSVSNDRKHSENFRVSPNGDYIAFAMDNIDSRTGNYGIKVFDASLKEVYNANYQVDEESYYVFDDFAVTNDAVVISAGKTYNKGFKEKKKGKANYKYTVHRISNKEVSSNNIDMGENFVNEVRFVQTESIIRMLGFYSEKSSFRMKGGISYTIKGTNIDDIKVKPSPFPKEVYSDLYGKAKAERLKKKQKEFASYYLDYSMIDELGNGYLTAEQFYVTTQTTGFGNNVNTVTTYHYDNILALKFDIEGNLVWGRTILKKANSPSYQPFVANNMLHILLNTGKNVKEKSNGRKKMKRSMFEKLSLFDVSFNPETGKKKMQIIQDKKSRRLYQPYLGSFGYNSFIMTNFSKRKRQFLILEAK